MLSSAPLATADVSLRRLPAEEAARATSDGTLLRLAMVVALYAIPVLVAVRPVADPIIDPDIWWHLRTGQWVVQHQAVPTTDPFSQPGLDKPWVAYSWLYEVLVYGLYDRLGLIGIVIYRLVLALAVVAALHRLVMRREPHFLTATGLTALGVLAIAMLFSERPWLFTILFTTLTLDAVLGLREGRRSRLVWLLPLVFVLWANIHIQFVYGLFLLGLACAAPVLDRLLGNHQDGQTASTAGARGWWKLVALTFACLLATLLNPFHVRLYGVVLEYATQPGPFRFVNELKAPEFREPSDWCMLTLAGAAAFALGRRKRLSSFEVLLLAATGFFAFRARRDLWFVVLAALAILATARRAPVAGDQRFVLTWKQRALVAGVTAVLALLVAWGRHLSATNLEAKVAGVFPVRAAAVVKERGYPGPLYNDFNWGGYFIWALPHLPVAIDGRTNLHGDERLVRFGGTWAGAPEFYDDLDLAAAGVVIADVQSPLASLLRRDGRFVLVHEDPVAIVFVAHRHARR